MQRVNLLRILFPNEQRSKSGRWRGGTQRVMGGGGRGGQRTGDSIPQPSGSIVSGMGGDEGTELKGRGGVTPRVSLINPKAEAHKPLPPQEVIYHQFKYLSLLSSSSSSGYCPCPSLH